MIMQLFTYNKHDVLSFAKTTGKFGGLSNMAADYVLFVNETVIPNTEALYQACKFSLYPNIQRLIIEESNPIISKRISRHYQSLVRSDWEEIKFTVMEWCIRLKLLQNWDRFGGLLKESGTSVIVEYSTKDGIWGAKPNGNNILEGYNILGRILMKMRAEYVIPNKKPYKILPPNVVGFLLYGQPIKEVFAPEYYLDD